MNMSQESVLISNLDFVKDRIVVFTKSGKRLKSPVSRHPVLARAAPADRSNFHIDGSGGTVSWPALQLTLTSGELMP